MTRSKPILAFASAVTLVMLVMLAACAHETPRELIAARSAYEQAAAGPSKELTPAELHVARRSLLHAEQLYDDKGDTSVVRDQAYIALRKAELAATLARTQLAQRMVAAAAQQTRQLKEQEVARTRSKLEATQEELIAERERRAAAEQRVAQVSADLARLATVKQDERGTVITLSGSVLFASGKYALLPAARTRLKQVADALMKGDPNTTFVVEGHTDSRGSAELNQVLSLNRANAVRDFLVEQGVPQERVTAEGHGAERPVADNSTVEGRANNRRVEIIVKPGRSA
ncbi:MAG: OmpA family protein [Nannocystis sp.]|nr:OmpA family protein [Nannocystis sp.]MBA3546380.1 OmpA family protein [Nannocystis sp.]